MGVFVNNTSCKRTVFSEIENIALNNIPLGNTGAYDNELYKTIELKSPYHKVVNVSGEFYQRNSTNTLLGRFMGCICTTDNWMLPESQDSLVLPNSSQSPNGEAAIILSQNAPLGMICIGWVFQNGQTGEAGTYGTYLGFEIDGSVLNIYRTEKKITTTAYSFLQPSTANVNITLC